VLVDVGSISAAVALAIVDDGNIEMVWKVLVDLGRICAAATSRAAIALELADDGVASSCNATALELAAERE
jgi:hypothetical protein